MKIIGDGSIVNLDRCQSNKCQHWRLKVNTEYGRKERRFTGSQAKARKALEQFKQELSISKSNSTFEQCADRWLSRRKHFNNVSEQTYIKNSRMVRRLNEQFGSMIAHEITRSIALDGLIEIKQRRNLGNTYTNELFVTMKAILKDSVSEGDIACNPLDGVKAPKVDTPKRRALSQEELDRFITTLTSQPLDAHTTALLIISMTGIRRGEVLGLKWRDIKRIGNSVILEIRRSVTDKGHIKEPKTPAGYRDIPIFPELAQVLATWQQIQKQKLSIVGIDQDSETHICCSEIGTVMIPQNLDRWWRKNRALYGLDDIVLHELRHTFFTILGNSGVGSAVLISIAGWSSLEEAKTYIHDDLPSKIRAIDSVKSTFVKRPFMITQGGTSGGTSNGTSNIEFYEYL